MEKVDTMEFMKVAIFDFTDCEGCEVELLGLSDILMKLANEHTIANFRLLSEFDSKGPFDLSIVEGVITTKEEIKKIKWVREQSKILVTFGACACTGGIHAILNKKKEREVAKNKIYGKLYKLKAKEIHPVSYYVKVDAMIKGCPPNLYEIRKALIYLLKGKIPPEKKMSVCNECPRGPFNSTKCLVALKKKCLGPFTYAGCSAICIEEGLYCWGCWGLKPEVKLEIVKNVLGKFMGDEEIKKLISSFNKDIEVKRE